MWHFLYIQKKIEKKKPFAHFLHHRNNFVGFWSSQKPKKRVQSSPKIVSWQSFQILCRRSSSHQDNVKVFRSNQIQISSHSSNLVSLQIWPFSGKPSKLLFLFKIIRLFVCSAIIKPKSSSQKVTVCNFLQNLVTTFHRIIFQQSFHNCCCNSISISTWNCYVCPSSSQPAIEWKCNILAILVLKIIRN